jgi:chromosome segregation ATPase
VDLDAAADQLYALAPDQLDGFASRRAELAGQARADGDRALAGQIGKLRKPVQAAALVNQLVREQSAAVADLTDLAHALREAHRHLRGNELRQLSERRQQVLGKLISLARKAGRRSVTDSVLDQVRATFEAAIADEAAEEAVLSGRLTAALSYSGFGAVDIGDAVAVPRRLSAVPDLPSGDDGKAGRKQDDGKAGRKQEDAEAARKPAERELARAERAHTEALDGLDAAIGELDAARARQAEVAEQIEELDKQLAAARKQADRAAKDAEAAEREHRRAARALERAERALADAQADLDELG